MTHRLYPTPAQVLLTVFAFLPEFKSNLTQYNTKKSPSPDFPAQNFYSAALAADYTV